jgi:hypothetical protein
LGSTAATSAGMRPSSECDRRFADLLHRMNFPRSFSPRFYQLVDASILNMAQMP